MAPSVQALHCTATSIAYTFHGQCEPTCILAGKRDVYKHLWLTASDLSKERALGLCFAVVCTLWVIIYHGTG